MKLCLSAVIFFLIVTPGCKDNITNPPEENPPGYQEDIPWPSLADSPWPKYRHDAQNTGRSNLSGPKHGIVNWKLETMYLCSELVVDTSSLFITGGYPWYFYCYDTSGSLKWKSGELSGPKIFTTPILTSERNIITADLVNIYSFGNNGELNWTFKRPVTGWFITGPAIDKEGNIYYTDASGNLYSLNKDGILNWQYSNPDFSSGEDTGIPFSPDGKTIYLSGVNTSIYSFDISEKKINWNINKGRIYSSPMIDCQGNIYFIAGKADSPNKVIFYSFSPSGGERFSYEFYSTWGDWKIDPTIDKNGNLFFAGDTLYSFNHEGKLRWKTMLPACNSAPLVNDRDGNIYLVLNNHTLLCVDNNGQIKLTLQYQLPVGATGYSPIIGYNNTIYLSDVAVHEPYYSVFSIK